MLGAALLHLIDMEEVALPCFDAAGCESEDATMLLVPPDRSSFKWLQQLPVFHAGII